VQQAWHEPLQVFNPFLRLHIKLTRTAKALRQWARGLIGNNRLLLCAAGQLIGILDVVQEHRQLTDDEIRLRRDLKVRFLGLTAVEKLRAQQKSRLTHIRANESSSKLFFLYANGRRRKNFIRHLVTEDGIKHTHQEKADAVFQHFNCRIGECQNREPTVDWDAINLLPQNLHHLEDDFTDQELKAIIQDIASDKAPGPDGFIGAFYKASWGIIKEDILAAVNCFFNRHDQHFNLLNNAHIVLLPKKEDDSQVGDFRPISLAHSVSKLISKLLSTRPSADLDKLVSRVQSAFIKKRSIQDNFLYTQNLVRELHRAKRPSLFLKLDIAKAFDTVRWDYLQEVMQRMGFGPKWRAWVTTLLATATSSVLLNGQRGKWFKHRTGLRQGDPLSPHAVHLSHGTTTTNAQHGNTTRTVVTNC